MNEKLLKGIEVSIEVNSRLANEYLNRSHECEKAGDDESRRYWYLNHLMLKGFVEELNKQKARLIWEER